MTSRRSFMEKFAAGFAALGSGMLAASPKLTAPAELTPIPAIPPQEIPYPPSWSKAFDGIPGKSQFRSVEEAEQFRREWMGEPDPTPRDCRIGVDLGAESGDYQVSHRQTHGAFGTPPEIAEVTFHAVMKIGSHVVKMFACGPHSTRAGDPDEYTVELDGDPMFPRHDQCDGHYVFSAPFEGETLEIRFAARKLGQYANGDEIHEIKLEYPRMICAEFEGYSRLLRRWAREFQRDVSLEWAWPNADRVAGSEEQAVGRKSYPLPISELALHKGGLGFPFPRGRDQPYPGATLTFGNPPKTVPVTEVGELSNGCEYPVISQRDRDAYRNRKVTMHHPVVMGTVELSEEDKASLLEACRDSTPVQRYPGITVPMPDFGMGRRKQT